VHAGVDINGADLMRKHDAVLLAVGAEQPRDLEIPGRDLKGIHYAMDYLTQQNKRRAGDRFLAEDEILATGKHVIIIGGGDTGADCLGTAHRQKAASVHQLQIHPMPPEDRHPDTPWPLWPLQLRVEAAHEEGGVREWSVLSTHFSGDSEGNVRKLHCVRVGPKPKLERAPNSDFYLDADLVLIAIGFSGPHRNGLLQQLPVTYDQRGNLHVDDAFMTNAPGVFAAGDSRRGQSLVVWAIAEGRKAAHHIDRFLMGSTDLPL
jgi:glutamate synthase (NADPH/NADH) small chain